MGENICSTLSVGVTVRAGLGVLLSLELPGSLGLGLVFFRGWDSESEENSRSGLSMAQFIYWMSSDKIGPFRRLAAIDQGTYGDIYLCTRESEGECGKTPYKLL